MKTLQQHIEEKLVINKNFEKVQVCPTSRKQLDDIITKRIEDSDNKYLDLSDINVSNIKDLSRLLRRFDFEVINVSGWNTSHVVYMNDMFRGCEKLKDIIGIENFTFDNCITISYIFAQCPKLNITNKIKNWKIDRDKTSISAMLWECPSEPKCSWI